jgi:enoyl-CoA hydratase/carnithine racemase
MLAVRITDGVARVDVDNPPINLLTVPLMRELARVADELAEDPDVRVVVLGSANADFFIAHFDVEAILRFPTSGPAQREPELNVLHAMCERFRTMPKATIAKIGGRVGGGGSELAASCDMRFGALGRTVVNQMEVALGILPAGTGTQRLPRLVGRGRALEMILGSDDIDAATAERWGYLNRTLPPDELDPFVDELARRIASFPPGAVARAKQSVLNAEPDPHDALVEEAFLFQEALRLPEAATAMRRFLALGGQTTAAELRMGELCAEVGSPTT